MNDRRPITMLERNNAMNAQETSRYRTQLALSAREDRRIAGCTRRRKRRFVRLLVPVRISGPPVRPAVQ